MKICAISFHSCPYSSLGGNGSGGMSVYLRELTNRLVDFPNVSVDIITRAQDPICVEAKDISPRIRVVQLKGGPERPIERTDMFQFIPEFAANLERYIHREKENYDIIHSHYWLSGLAGGYVKHKMGIPLVHAYHTLAFKKGRKLGQKEHKRREVSERHLAHISDLIISPSTEERDNLVDEYGLMPAKVRVVYPGVNPRLFYPVPNREVLKKTGLHGGDFILLFVGRIEPVKGLMNLVEALSILKRKNPPLFAKTRLIVIGGGKKRKELAANEEVRRIKAAVERLELEDRVRFMGSVSQAQLRKYYSAADALIIPSLYESFGLVTVEALACGTPVLASQIGEMKNIVKDGKNGLSFYPCDPISLAQSIEKLSSHRSRLWSPASIREDILRRYSWDNTADDTYRIYKRLVYERLRSKTIFQPGESLRPV